MPPALLTLLDRIGGPRRATILVIGFAAAAGVFGVARWLGAPAWVPAFAELPIGEVGTVTDRLTQANIEYRLSGNGTTLLVRETDVARAKVELARAGMLPNPAKPGYEGLAQNGFGVTEELQRVNIQRALEGELERTIGGMRGIKSARVALVMPEPESYGVAAEPAEASVTLEPDGGDAIRPEVVRGIAITVAASVEGLSADRVTIVDASGVPLTSGDDATTVAGVTSRQLEEQTNFENQQRRKVEQMLLPLVGPRRSTVTVNATLSFDRVQRTTATVDPDRQALATEMKDELIPGAEGGAATSKMTNEYVNSTATEKVESAVGTVKRLSVAVALAAPEAPGTDSTAGAARSTLTDTTALIAKVDSLVKTAVGYDEARGDVVTVTMLPFQPPRPLPTAAPPTTMETLQSVQRPALTGLGILLAFVVAMLTLRAAGRTTETLTPVAAGAPAGYLTSEAAGMAPAFPAPYAAQGLAAGAHAPGLPAGTDVAHAPPARPQPMIVVPNNPMREQVLASVEQQPEVAAKLMRAWLREG